MRGNRVVQLLFSSDRVFTPWCGTVAVLLMLWGGASMAQAAAVQTETLILSGSTTVQKRLLEPTQQLLLEQAGIRLKIKGVGSGSGFKQLMKGEVKGSIASSPLQWLLERNELADDGTYREHILTEDVIVPIIHPTNPVQRLSWEELAAIHNGEITNWKEVGGADQKITVITSHNESATRAVFRALVMKGTRYVRGARKVKTTRREVNLVERIKGGVGAVSEGFVLSSSGKVKVVESERIARPLSIITKGEADPTLQLVIDFLRSDSAIQRFK